MDSNLVHRPVNVNRSGLERAANRSSGLPEIAIVAQVPRQAHFSTGCTTVIVLDVTGGPPVHAVAVTLVPNRRPSAASPSIESAPSAS